MYAIRRSDYMIIPRTCLILSCFYPSIYLYVLHRLFTFWNAFSTLSSSFSFADASIQYVTISVANSNLIGESRCISTTWIRIPNKFIDSIIPHILPPFITVWISFIVVEVDVTVQHTMDFDSDFLFSNKSFQNVRQLQAYLSDRVRCHYHCGESSYLQHLMSSCFKSATSVADSKR